MILDMKWNENGNLCTILPCFVLSGYTLADKLVFCGAYHRPRWSMILGLVIGT